MARKEALTTEGKQAEKPRIVADLRDQVRQTDSTLLQRGGLEPPGIDFDINTLSGPTPTESGGLDGMGGQVFTDLGIPV